MLLQNNKFISISYFKNDPNVDINFFFFDNILGALLSTLLFAATGPPFTDSTTQLNIARPANRSMT